MGTSEKNTLQIALISFLSGGLLGAGLALLLAPQSGKKTRAQIKDIAEDVRDSAVEYAEKLKKKVF